MNFLPESVNHRFITYSDSLVRHECKQVGGFFHL